MEGWLNLRLFIPNKNLRALVYACLKERFVIRVYGGLKERCVVRTLVICAHNSGTFEITSKISHYCAYYGYFTLLQWMHSKGSLPLDGNTCAIAAANGHLHIFQWAVANGFPWGYEYCLQKAKTKEIRDWLVKREPSLLYY